MGTFIRCLCMILTLSMAGSRPTAAIRNGTFESDPWWGTREAQEIRRAFDESRKSGDFVSLERAAQRASDLALRRQALIPAARYLIYLGGARMALFHYRAALDAFLKARDLADRAGDRFDSAAIAGNLSTLFLEMSDMDSALRLAQQAYLQTQPLRHPPFEQHVVLQLGKLYALSGDGRAEAMFREGIEAARIHGDSGQEARGWDLLGEQWLRHGQLNDAERAFTEGFRIRKLSYRADLPFSYGRLGALRLAQERLDEAERFTDQAILAGRRVDSAFPSFRLKHQRGEIHVARGEIDRALVDFESAADLATQWRRETLPANSTLTATNIELEKRIFDSLVETAAHLAVERSDRRLAVESFQALEENRAASLRQALARGGTWKERLPVRYWDVLGELRAEQARLMRVGLGNSVALQDAKVKLSEMESKTEQHIFVSKNENIHTQSSLIHIQQVLRGSDLLLSFHLGEKESYLWAVTSGTLVLYRLAPAGELRRMIRSFREAVREGRPEAAESGERLCRQLFGGLSLAEVGKHAWLLSVDDELFEAPLAALVTEQKGSQVTYLMEQHSLQLVPGALSLAREQAPRAGGGLLGVGDPIYNVADPRWRRPFFQGWFAATTAPELSRLVASGDEVRAIARSWGRQAVVLAGSNATRERFQQELERHPSVMHLATHVVTPPERPGQAMIAFGLDPHGTQQFLTTADVAMLQVPGAVVTMTGCSTGTGEIRPGAGLLGLARAWQMAGASTVVTTSWPVRDTEGELFAAFYGHLHQLPGSVPASEALRQSQVEMLRSGTWRGSPGYWGAYQVTGGGR